MAKLSPDMRKRYAKTLQDALVDLGQLEELYRNVFDEDLSTIRTTGMSQPDVIAAILKHCESRDKCDQLIAAAVEINPDNKALQSLRIEIGKQAQEEKIAEIELEDTPSEQNIGFVNRKSELEKIFLTPGQISRYWVVDAPAGYGKTQLLGEVEKRYKQEKWVTAWIEFPRREEPGAEDQTKPQLINLVAHPILNELGQAPGKYFDTSQTAEDIGMDISTAILNVTDKVEKNVPPGVAIVIDSFENCRDDDVQMFVEFISGIFTGLDNSHSFFTSKKLRVFISGRYARNKIKNARDQFMLADISLAPFTFEVIADTIQEFAISKGISGDFDQAKDIAAHLMHITGGHPGFTAKILNQLAQERFTKGTRPLVQYAEQYQADFTKDFYHQLLKESPKLGEHPLIEILMKLSPFRKYDRWCVLKGLGERGLLPTDVDEESIEKALLNTYLVDRQRGFLQDGIYRYLLEIWLRINHPKDYATLCEAGIELYKGQIGNPDNVRSIDKWAIEFIYLSLIRDYQIHEITGKELTKRTQDNVNWVVQELARMKPSLSEMDAENMHEGFLNGLREDAELRFKFNFCTIQNNEFDNRPYENLLSFVSDAIRKVL